jgi:hypothetical protein
VVEWEWAAAEWAAGMIRRGHRRHRKQSREGCERRTVHNARA